MSRPDLIMGALVLFALFGKLTDAALAHLTARAERWRGAWTIDVCGSA